MRLHSFSKGHSWQLIVRKFAERPVCHRSVSVSSATPLDSAKPFNEIPGPKGLPYLGTLFKYTWGPYSPSSYHKALLQNHKKYGKIFKETICGQTRVHLFDPDYIQAMYSMEGRIPHIPPLLETTKMYRQYREMSPGLGNTNGEEWYRLRSAVQQMMLQPRAVSQFLPHVNEVVDDFIQRIHRMRNIDTGQVENFHNDILRWTLESSAFTCFERRLSALDPSDDGFPQKMIDANHAVLSLSLKLRFSVPWFKLLPTKTWKKLVQAEDFFFGNAQKLVNETCAEIQSLIDSNQLNEDQYAFLSYLLGKKEISFKDVSIIAMSLFADGLSTTSPSTIGQLYCLATNAEVQDKLYREVKRVVGDPNLFITTQHLNQLSYLRCCIKEGFRFFPIGTEVSRLPQRDVVIGGYHIPAGTHVELNNNMLLRMEEYFDKPDSYIPERWVRGGSASSIHPYLLLPFGFGPRTCAGRRFAEQEMQVFITKLLLNFRLEWHEPHGMEQTYRVLLTPSVPANFTFIPR